MDVLTITNWYPPHHFGGYELSCFDVMTRLEQRGHRVRVLCSDQQLPTSDPPTEHDAVVRRQLRLYHTGEDLLRPSWPQRYAIERNNQQVLRDAVAERRPDVVSVWHLAALSWGLMATIEDLGLPVVYVVCDEWPAFGLRLDPWAGPFSRNAVTRGLGRVVEAASGLPTVARDLGRLGPALYVSDDVRHRVRDQMRGSFVDDTVTFSGIERTLFAPGPARPWSWRLLCTGRFDPRKGYDTAIRCLPLLPDHATLDIYGRGGEEERARLVALAQELGVGPRVRVGTRERAEMADAYRAADAFVFPSEWAEPFGLVPLEAMACGTPVVATCVGGSREFLQDGTNVLRFDPGDHRALAERLRTLAGDPDLRARLVANGLRTSAAMDLDRLTDVMEQWHLHVTGGLPARPADRVLPGPAG